LSLPRSPASIIARIIEALAENGGIMKDNQLFELLRREFDISYSDMMKYLMLLEIRGFVTVSSARENVRIVSLTRFGKEQLGVR